MLNKLNIKLTQRRAILALLCFLFFLQIKAQPIYNLVSNGSFEDTLKCPSDAGQLYNCKHWFNPVIFASPDYYNSCANSNPLASRIKIPNNILGYQFPRTGNAYAGIGTFVVNYPNNREYLKNKLKQKMKTGSKYCVTFFVTRSDSSIYANANMGIYFSNDSIINPFSFPPTLINITPPIESNVIILDTINWVKIEGLYTASGTENFLTIGNYKNDLATPNQQTKPHYPDPGRQNYSYYYIDDVSVVEMNSANASIKDTLFSRCVSDSVILGTDSTEFATYTWSSTVGGLSALSCTNCPNPVAKPQVTTKYYLTKVQCSATTMDSVVVMVRTPTTIANAGNSQLICEGDIVQIGTQDSLAYTSYTWLPTTGLSCSNCATPYANPNATTIYNLTRNECNVTTTSSVKISIDDCNPTFTVPNVFTPNYDGVNDTWGVTFSSSKYIKNFQMQIYNRWGLLIYQTNTGYSTPNIKWDGHTTSGSECSTGVYYYIISFDKYEEKVELKGTISLFR